jgi:uncharacterized protein (DUF1330 family)
MSDVTPTPVYVLALLRVDDVEAYRREYGRPVLAQLEACGATLLVASAHPTILEGEFEATWTAVFKFPDRATAMRWYESAEYAPLKKRRMEELSAGGTVALFDEFVKPPAPA